MRIGRGQWKRRQKRDEGKRMRGEFETDRVKGESEGGEKEQRGREKSY